MARSKRNKVVPLTKVTKKVKQNKSNLIKSILLNIKHFKHLLICSYHNLPSTPFHQLKQLFPDTKFCLGKHSVLAKALGSSQQQQFLPNLSQISRLLKGDTCLVFTNMDVQKLIEYLNDYQREEFAKAGTVAPKTIVLEKDSNVLYCFAGSIEPYLRKLGLNTRLINGKIELLQNFILSVEGKPLGVQQCKILKLLKIRLTTFQLKVLACWNSKTYSLKIYD